MGEREREENRNGKKINNIIIFKRKHLKIKIKYVLELNKYDIINLYHTNNIHIITVPNTLGTLLFFTIISLSFFTGRLIYFFKLCHFLVKVIKGYHISIPGCHYFMINKLQLYTHFVLK